MSEIEVTLTITAEGFEVEPNEDITHWMPFDSLADVVMGLNRNLPHGQYLIQIRSVVKSADE